MGDAEAAWTLASGVQVDHYRIDRALGRGGMGEVYVARDLQLGRRVALKLIRGGSTGTDRAAARARLEARTTARLAHPNIITIYAVGEYDERPYLALELVDGETLRARLDAGDLALGEAVRIAAAIADALAEAHRHGVQHRDLKPTNVLLGRDGRPRVLDFGLAGLASDDGVTDAGRGGTPAYMAPEQRRPGELTPAVDVYAFGVVLHELLTGRRPPDGDVPPLSSIRSEIPSALDTLVRDCLAPDPGARPSAELLHERLVELASLDGNRRGRDTSPFKGLLPFTEDDVARFFGRDDEVGSMVERLRSVAFVGIVGGSGAGKSSFVQAGLIPRLRERGPLRVVQLRPGRTPLATLAQRVREAAAASHRASTASLSDSDVAQVEADPHPELADLASALAHNPALLGHHLQQIHERTQARVLLFVDQLEEVVTAKIDDAERRAFMDAVCLAAEDPNLRVRTLVTVREELLSRVVATASVGGALQQILVLQNPGAAALGDLLRAPVEAAGYTWEDTKLIDDMTAEVEGARACLPLLQFAASRLWEERDRTRWLLLRSAYERMGGVAGALARHADAVLDAMPAPQLTTARSLLLRLVTPERTRRAVTLEALVDGLGPEASAVVDRLVEHRLLVTQRNDADGVATVEIVHESLFESWGRLATWLTKTSEERVRLEEIGHAAASWARSDRDASALWRGSALRDAVRTIDSATTDVDPLSRAFVEHSVHRERRRRWQVRGLTAFVIIFLAVSAIGFALGQRRADQERVRAVERRAEAQLSAAQAAYARGQPLESRAHLRASLETRDLEGARWLWRRLAEDPLVWTRTFSPYVLDARFDPTGERLALATSNGAVLIVDPRTARTVRTLPSPQGSAASLTWSSDGRLVSVNRKGASAVWTDDDEPQTLDGDIAAATFAGPNLVVAIDREVQRVEPDDTRTTIGRHPSPVRALAATSTTVFSVGDDGVVRSWSTGGAAGPTRKVGTPLLSVAAHGERIAAGATDGRVHTWRNGRRWSASAHATPVFQVRFSADGRRLLSASRDGVVLWDFDRGVALDTYTCRGRAIGATFTPREDQLTIACREGLVRTLRYGLDRTGDVRPAHDAETISPSFDPTGQLIVSGGSDSRALLWDVDVGRARDAVLPHDHPVWSTTFIQDGATLATAQGDGRLRLWDVASGRSRRELAGHTGGVYDLVANGDTLASWGTDGMLRRWDLGTSRLSWAREAPCGTGTLDVADDGHVLFACFGKSGGLHLFAPDGTDVRAHARGTDITFARWRHDGRTIFYQDTSLRVFEWDPRTGRTDVLRESNGLWVTGWHRPSETIAMANRDIVRLVDLEGRTTPRGFDGHARFTNYARFDASGRLVVTSGGDGAVRLWNAEDATPRWWTSAVLQRPPRLRTHRGWLALDRVPAEVVEGPAWSKPSSIAVSDPLGRRLCVLADGELRALDASLGTRIDSWPIEGTPELRATADACLALRGDAVWRYDAEGARAVVTDATGLSVDAHAWYVTTSSAVHVFGREGARRFDITGEPRTAARVGRWIVVGFDRGHIRTIDPTTGAVREVALEQSPQSPIEALLEGPRGSLIAGYRTGVVIGWDLETGVRLVTGALNGRALHLFADEERLYAASELGDFATWDLTAISRPYCELLEEVWRSVPVVWERGAPVAAAAPTTHRCWNGPLARD